MLVTKEFTFDAAHYLPDYHGKCETMHGHTYKMHITVQAEVEANGMAYDFIALKEIVKKEIISQLDHQLLNDFIPIPSAENIAIWSWEKLATKIPLFEIKVWETPTSFITYQGK